LDNPNPSWETIVDGLLFQKCVIMPSIFWKSRPLGVSLSDVKKPFVNTIVL
jgi:hypothetical protein